LAGSSPLPPARRVEAGFLGGVKIQKEKEEWDEFVYP